mmetsp:Transcript_4278/g.13804  ORF Transcript_4278/g.13804 Transcript_4278/m.13804 type:complete len:298 (+) Transcript_4278:82-975(+)
MRTCVVREKEKRAGSVALGGEMQTLVAAGQVRMADGDLEDDTLRIAAVVHLVLKGVIEEEDPAPRPRARLRPHAHGGTGALRDLQAQVELELRVGGAEMGPEPDARPDGAVACTDDVGGREGAEIVKEGASLRRVLLAASLSTPQVPHGSDVEAGPTATTACCGVLDALLVQLWQPKALDGVKLRLESLHALRLFQELHQWQHAGVEVRGGIVPGAACEASAEALGHLQGVVPLPAPQQALREVPLQREHPGLRLVTEAPHWQAALEEGEPLAAGYEEGVRELGQDVRTRAVRQNCH